MSLIQCFSECFWDTQVFSLFQGMGLHPRSGNVIFTFSQSVSALIKFSPLYPYANVWLFSSFPQLFVRYYLRPPNPKNVPKTSINIGLQLLCNIVCHQPCFAAIQQGRFYTGVEQLNFEVQTDVVFALQIFFNFDNVPLVIFILCSMSNNLSSSASIPEIQGLVIVHRHR